MNPNTTPEIDMKEIYAYAASLIKADYSESALLENLMRRGLDEDTANNVLKNIYQVKATATKKDSREAGKRNMIIGALWCVGGIAVTLYTLQTAKAGGSYVVTWGAIIFGGIFTWFGTICWNAVTQ